VSEDEKVGTCLGEQEEEKIKEALTNQRERMIVQCCSGTIEEVSKCIEQVDDTIEKVVKEHFLNTVNSNEENECWEEKDLPDGTKLVREYWDVGCVDRYGKIWHEAMTKAEAKKMEDLLEQMESPILSDRERDSLYREAVQEILVSIHKRKLGQNSKVLRYKYFPEEPVECEKGLLGYSESWILPYKKMSERRKVHNDY
jgi:hypothetical protein